MLKEERKPIVSKIVLDSSALIALIKNEPGAEEVEKVLGQIVMSSVNVSEVVGILLEGDMSYSNIQECTLPLISSIIDFDQEQAFKTASLKKITKSKGLSLGDRACLSLGMILQAPIYTADKIWKELDLPDLEIHLIR